MPDSIRITGGSFRAQPPHNRFGGRFGAGIAAALCILGRVLGPGAAQAQPDEAGSALDPLLSTVNQLDRPELITITLTLGILCFAVVTSIMLVRTSRRLAETEAAARDVIMAARAEADRVNALLRSDPQVLVAWAAADDKPEIIGDTAVVTGDNASHRLLTFGTWLAVDEARTMERLVARLRARGEGFATTVRTRNDRPIEVEGHVIGGRAILRLKDVSGIRRELAELTGRFHRQIEETEALRTLIEALPFPIWARDEAGKLIAANPAYARAVDARDSIEAVNRGIELFDRSAREELYRAHEAARSYTGRLPAIVAGARRTFEVLTFPTRRGSSGIGIEATEAESLRAEIKRMTQAQRRTLDQLPTGVAIFGSDQKLAFYNSAYRELWDLDAAFLDNAPTDSGVLEQLRAARKLPEEQDFRLWKAQLHEAYRALEPMELTWHLPDGRTLRVVTTPNPEGGVIYLFQDNTKRLDLERRYDEIGRAHV